MNRPLKNKKILSESHRKKISESNTGKKNSIEHNKKIALGHRGKVQSYIHNLKNMKGHLKYNVTIDWLSKFDSIKKLQYLNWSISRKRDYFGFTDEIYIAFIEKFYYDKKFNQLYDNWIITNDKWIKPSLDHIIPKSKGGSLIDVNNLQFISWLENRAKNNMSQSNWNIIKQKILEYF